MNRLKIVGEGGGEEVKLNTDFKKSRFEKNAFKVSRTIIL